MTQITDFYRAQVILRPVGVEAPRERYTMTFHFRNDEVGLSSGAIADRIRNRLQSFFENTVEDTNIMPARYIPSWIRREVLVNVYDLGLPASQRPVIQREFEMPLGTQERALPTEAAARLSIVAAAAPVTQGSASNPKVRPRRRSGGVYFGPLSTAVSGGATNGSTRATVSQQARQVLAGACEALATQSQTNAVRWALVSPTLGQAWLVTGGFVDEDFDHQRSRRIETPARTKWGSAL